MIDTEIREDSITDLMACSWLTEDDDTKISPELPHDHVLSENIDQYYDLGSAIEYDVYLRRRWR